MDFRILYKGVIMGTFLDILLDILAILVIIVVGSLVVVIVAELILYLLDSGRRRKEDDEESNVTKVVNDEDIVVYSDAEKEKKVQKGRSETIDDDQIEEIDYDKAIEEQKMLQAKRGVVTQEVKPAPQPQPQPAKPVEKEPENDDIFWDNDEDDEFNKLLDEIVKEAKKAGEVKEEVKEEPKEEVSPLTDETKKELDELKALKEQQKKEIEEMKQMREDFAREKEEQLALYKENLNKAKEEELERLRQEAIKEQEKLEKLQDELEEERQRLEEEKAKLKDDSDKPETEDQEPIVKETIIKDEEEINKLKYKNLMRMNNRLNRIIRDTERLQDQKQREQEKALADKKKALEKQEEEKRREQEKLVEITKQEQEKLRKQKEALEKQQEISKKLQEASRRAGKYKLDTKVIKLTKERPVANNEVEEVVVPAEVNGKKQTPRSASKPVFAKEYYEARITELEEELKEVEKELRANKAEYIPLTRIHKAYARDSEKLRKKEVQVAKQKVALYGVNSKNVDASKKAKLDENLQALAELKDSVQHCEEIIKKNKDRYPVIEKNNQLITKHIDRINEEMKICEKALDYYNKK